jgi:hypothetical protein
MKVPKLKWFYHGTTLENYAKIQADGFLDPTKGNGNLYKNTLFLTNSDKFARVMTAFKHAKYNGQEIVVYKIPGHILDKSCLTTAEGHFSQGLATDPNMVSFKYTKPISIDDTFVAKAPVNLNLPEGVSIVRDGTKTGLSFTPEAAEQWLKEAAE